MKTMVYLALAALFAALLAVPMAWGQEEVYFINNEALGTHQRALVRFGHQEHLDWTGEACITCHHDLNENLGVSDSDGAKCSECHEAQATPKNRVDLLTAYHTRCKGCHQSLLEKGKQNAPVMCGQCHKRSIKPPADE